MRNALLLFLFNISPPPLFPAISARRLHLSASTSFSPDAVANSSSCTATMAAMAQRLLLSPSPELLGPMRRTASSSLSSLSSVPAALQRLQGQGTRAGQSRKPMAACFFGSKATATDKRQEEGRPVVEEAKAQVLYVYEINDRDRYSPVLLRSPENRQAPGLTGVVDATGLPVLAIGDLVPFSNKLYDGSLTLRVGITAGFSNVIATVPDKGQRYEAFYSFYFGDLGHISVQGPYITYQDSELAVTGGSGIFRGVYGYVKLHQIVFPIKLFYTFYLFGTPKLPEILKKKHVEPTVDAVPSTAAREARPEASLPNYSN